MSNHPKMLERNPGRRERPASVCLLWRDLLRVVFVPCFGARGSPSVSRTRARRARTLTMFCGKCRRAGTTCGSVSTCEFPSGTTNVTAPRTLFANDASTERWSVTRTGGLTGDEVHITGLEATMTDALVRIENLDGTNSSNSCYPIIAVVCGSSCAERAGSYAHLPGIGGGAHSIRR